MGLDTFPLLQDQTFLITYSNNVFKLKLEYQEISQDKKEIFVQAVSEQAAHCQIEDVCRALLYSIEREEKLLPVQTDNFIIYPEVSRWSLGNKVMFIVDGKPLSCHQDIILLKLTCKDVAVSEEDQVVVSPSSKWSSCKPSHDMSNVRADNSQTNKISTPVLHDNSNAYTKMSCVNNNATINETPPVAINNGRGGQSPESFNKITTIVRKHCSKTHLTNAIDQMNLKQLSGNEHTKNKMSAHKEIILPNRFLNQRDKLADQESKKEFQKLQLMNIGSSVRKVSSCGLSQDDCTQDKDRGMNTYFRRSSQPARVAINKTRQNDITVQLGVINWNKASQDNNKLRLSNNGNGQGDRGLREPPAISSSQSNNSSIGSERGSEGGTNKQRLKMVTRLGSHKRNSVCSTVRYQGISKNEKKHSKLFRNKADAGVVKSLNTELKRNSNVMAMKHTHKHESKRINKASSETEGSDKIIYKTSTKNMNCQDHFNEMKQYSNSLETNRTSAVEISHDGSMIEVSAEKMNNFESVNPDTLTGSGQKRKRKNHISPKVLDCDKEIKKKCVSSELSQEKVNVKVLKHMDSKETITDHNNSSDYTITHASTSTPTKRQMIFRKTSLHEYGSHSGSIRSVTNKGQQLKVRRKLKGCSSIGCSVMSLRSQTNSKRREQGSRLHSNKITDFNGFTTVGHNSINTRQTRRLHVERFLIDSSKFSNCSHRSDKEYANRNLSRAIKNSNNYKIYKSQSMTKKNLQKNVSTDLNNEKAQTSSGRTSSTLNSSKRVTRSVSAKSSHLGTICSPRTAYSKKGSLSNPSEQSGNETDSTKAKRTLHKAQKQLIKSKDGIWLFWRS